MINETERVLVCCGRRCADDAQKIANAIEEELAQRGCDSSPIKVIRVGCAGECDQGPIVRLMPRDVTYYRVSVKYASAIVDSLYGEPTKKLLFKKKRQHFEKLSDNPFFGLQHRVALRYTGVIDPSSIEDYIAHGGYAVLKKAQAAPRFDILAKLQESGLRIKCEASTSQETTWLEAENRAFQRIACNVNANGFDDPVGIALAEGSPHALVEGMAIAMHAIGAIEGVFYMGQKDAQALSALQRAIKDACASEIFEPALGKLECKIGLSEPGGDAFESTTLSVDAETLAAIPAVLGEHLDHRSSEGGVHSEETKAFALDGKAKHIGFVEAPMGTTLRTFILKIGGGVAGDRPLKAVEVGKPAGSFLPEPLLNLPVDFDSFAEHDIPMDAGSINVLDDRSCIVKTVRNDFQHLYAQNQIADSTKIENLDKAIALLGQLCAGDGEANDIELLERIGLSMRNAAANRCERRAANSLLSAIEHFRSEFEAHSLEKRCPSGSCPKLTRFVISPEACAGCDVCSNACPTKAIAGEQRQPHVIDYGKCTSCGMCRDLCRFHAVLTERRLLTSDATNHLGDG